MITKAKEIIRAACCIRLRISFVCIGNDRIGWLPILPVRVRALGPPVEPFQVETPSPWARYDTAKGVSDVDAAAKGADG